MPETPTAAAPVQLPALPKPFATKKPHLLFDSNQMHAYARAAMEPLEARIRELEQHIARRDEMDRWGPEGD